MIYTITLNPALDHTVWVSAFQKGQTNRAERESCTAGGKGINVSLMLATLGVASTALGFLAGFTGAEIEKELQNDLITPSFIHLKSGFSRINIKIQGKNESEINCPGPAVDAASLDRFFHKLHAIQDSDALVLAGNIPSTLPDDTYARVLQAVQSKRVQTVVDASGKLLSDSLAYRPFLIKPNRQELSELFGTPIYNRHDAERCARELKKAGAQNVLVSLGGDGALLIDEFDRLHTAGTLPGTVKGTVGAGDSMVAGFLAGWHKTGDYTTAFRLANACGMATAFSDWLGDKQTIDRCFSTLNTSL